MHEMALSASVIALVEDAARRENFSRARVVVLELGELGHVEPEAMLFCFDAVSRGTVAEGARLDIVRVPGAGWCLDCARTVALSERFGACPDCGGRRVQMTAGDELRVRELEVD
ncbi:hydrogenase maturation nickel metallochaperone HypA [Rhodoplanes sp. TEM]|uniref:Hydrogenase maturation factor HypA n=1 Tax=Rhodoplanes tepidamans TaxID=200616 RepID=A0ABT5JBS2_RHOTP|nr:MULTISPECIES: hydrogenase maturation nickel metallochaperone HypA [Rhodoplanes]MDC7786998.1 hydrogenase maturation nickel metallochaperone HypA [Rhodoplanes tepidamans]MDC7987006.1 hydrogenase maturation nickel metallochaperone HypA [Rhodoplanes sp. TEM]MDQ0354277.1 hydrogenase nickel incorporation protein HypA/HybF [Rhodoplanes tepidamans]